MQKKLPFFFDKQNLCNLPIAIIFTRLYDLWLNNISINKNYKKKLPNAMCQPYLPKKKKKKRKDFNVNIGNKYDRVIIAPSRCI